MNHLTILGTLVRDTETKTVGDNTVTSFTVAYNEKYKGKETSMFLDVEMWSKKGEVFAQYHSKGSKALLSGKLKQDNWEDKEGNKRSKIKLSAFDFTFLPRSEAAAPASDTYDGDAPF